MMLKPPLLTSYWRCLPGGGHVYSHSNSVRWVSSLIPKLARRKMYPRSSIQKEVVWGLGPMLVLIQISASWNSILASILCIYPKTRLSSIALVVASFQTIQRQESSSYQVLKMPNVSKLPKCRTSVKSLRIAPGRGLTPPENITSPSPASELALDCI